MSRTRRHPLPRHTARTAAFAGAAALAVTLTACSGGQGGDGKSALQTGAKVSVAGNKAGQPVKVTSGDGALKSVAVKTSEGEDLAGKISADGKSWTSDRVAAPGTTYKIDVKDDQGRSAQESVTTQKPDKVNKVTFAPGNADSVGVAQPLSITFDHPVKNKADVEKHLKVTTSDNTEGSWGWIKDYSGRDRVDWRPKEYWKSGTKVKVEADLDGIDSGDGGWFVRDYDMDVTIGRNQAIKVDLDSKQLTFLRDGQVVKTIPVAAGTPGGEKASWSGKLVLMRKEGTIRMTSQSVGLGDAYDKMVDDSMRVTQSGMYLHAAPWNNGNFGKVNNSSGCVGMSKADADWVYTQAQAGDPVEVTGQGSKGQPQSGNGYTEWNLSWAQWQAKSALHADATGTGGAN
uniref:L,D-transpeptidase n=1 Tax=Streptomyces polyasparticus TaxID=2767826 RepID=UPI001BE48077|nr:Ig-like domain-containing protein [Streptomyces polyasparticus]